MISKILIGNIIANATTQAFPLQVPLLKRSKFCSLRPPHVQLINQMPHNVCYCLYHTNFIECCTPLHNNLPQFPSYGEDLMSLLPCDTNNETNKDCWLRKCTRCNVTTIRSTIEQIKATTISIPSSVKWMVWKKDASGIRYIKSSEIGSIEDLVQHFIDILEKFLIHSYTKRAQAASFENDRKRMNLNYMAILQIDYAENYTCVSQDEVQSAHWHQKTASELVLKLAHKEENDN